MDNAMQWTEQLNCIMAGCLVRLLRTQQQQSKVFVALSSVTIYMKKVVDQLLFEKIFSEIFWGNCFYFPEFSLLYAKSSNCCKE